MARPIKERRVCDLPKKNEFGPIGSIRGKENIVEMTVDEYETIRLIDYENLGQEECADHMGIARATVQRIYSEARVKIATAIVNGKRLKIEGGNYILCKNNHCDNRKCGKRHRM